MITHSIISSVTQADLRVAAGIKYEAEFDIVDRYYLVQPDTNLNFFAEDQKPSIESNLKVKELDEVVEKVKKKDQAVADIIAAFQYLTLEDALREVIHRGTTLLEPERVMDLEDIAAYMDISFTDKFLQDTYGFTVEQVDVFYARVAAAVALRVELSDFEGSALDG